MRARLTNMPGGGGGGGVRTVSSYSTTPPLPFAKDTHHLFISHSILQYFYSTLQLINLYIICASTYCIIYMIYMYV